MKEKMDIFIERYEEINHSLSGYTQRRIDMLYNEWWDNILDDEWYEMIKSIKVVRNKKAKEYDWSLTEMNYNYEGRGVDNQLLHKMEWDDSVSNYKNKYHQKPNRFGTCSYCGEDKELTYGRRCNECKLELQRIRYEQKKADKEYQRKKAENMKIWYNNNKQYFTKPKLDE